MRLFYKYLSAILFWLMLSSAFSAFLFFSEIDALQSKQQTLLLRERSAFALQFFEAFHGTLQNKKDSQKFLAHIKTKLHSDVVLWRPGKETRSTLSPLQHNKLARLLRDTIPDKNSFILEMTPEDLRFQFKKAPSGNIWIAAAVPARSDYGLNGPALTKFILSTLLFLLLTGLTVYFITRSSLKPVREMTRALSNAASGKLNTIPHFNGNDEIHLLAFRFNRYAAGLSGLLNSQREREAGLTQKLHESHSKLVKLTDNLERVVARRTAELREKDAQLLQTGKLAGLGQLSAGIAHEINQPLNIIKLIVTGMMRQYSVRKTLNTDEVVKELNTINQQTIRVQKIIGHMKSFARKRAHITFSEIDINESINDSMLLIGRQLEDHNITLRLELEENLPGIWGDSIQVEQILVNLLNNARDAVEIKESALLQKGHKAYKKKISIRTFTKKQKVCMEIADNGCGMTEEISRKLFEPFFSTKGQKGTGLGMSITYNLVKNLNGEISVSSKLAKGTVFIVSFPRFSEREEKEKTESPSV